MKLFELHDTDQFDEKKFETDCSFYLEQLGDKAKTLFMYRGTDSQRPKINEKNLFSPRKKPVDIPNKVHTEVNEFFLEKFGKPFRSGLFVAGDSTSAVGYGKVYIIVPIGEFEWLSNSDFVDLFSVYEDTDAEGKEAHDILMQAVMSSKKWKHNTNLVKCIESGAEIMLWCPNGYYMFNEDGYGDFLPSAMWKG